jgi:TPR repeat protein
MSVAFSPDGNSVLSGSLDKTLRFWDFSCGQRYIDLEPKVGQAQATLQKNPDDAAALAVLGEWYAFRGVNDWAVELLEKARAGGAAVLPLTLARCYWELSGELPPRSLLTRERCLAGAVREYSAALASSDDGREQAYLQLCLSAVQDTSARWASLQAAINAADSGDTDAMYHLGRLYRDDPSVDQHYQQAMQWFVKAAAAGSVAAMNSIGSLYEHGSGVPQDYAEAMKWYRKAADGGNSGGMENVALLYGGGHGVTQDYKQAMIWYRKAADAGYARAMRDLGYMYENGEGVTPDLQQAIQWYRKGADAGNADAKDALGRLATTQPATAPTSQNAQ